MSVPLLWIFMLYKKRDKIRARVSHPAKEIDQSMMLRNEHKVVVGEGGGGLNIFSFFLSLSFYLKLLFSLLFL
jgi:hypothetical protein